MTTRPLGLTIGGIILVFHGPLFLLVAVAGVLGEGRLSESLIFGRLSVLLLAAAIGILRVRPWARGLVLIMAALWGVGNGVGAVMLLSIGLSGSGHVSLELIVAALLPVLWLAYSL